MENEEEKLKGKRSGDSVQARVPRDSTSRDARDKKFLKKTLSIGWR